MPPEIVAFFMDMPPAALCGLLASLVLLLATVVLLSQLPQTSRQEKSRLGMSVYRGAAGLMGLICSATTLGADSDLNLGGQKAAQHVPSMSLWIPVIGFIAFAMSTLYLYRGRGLGWAALVSAMLTSPTGALYVNQISSHPAVAQWALVVSGTAGFITVILVLAMLFRSDMINQMSRPQPPSNN